MTTKEAIAKAASLFAEWVEGDEFEYEGTTPGKYYACPATDVVRWLFGDVAVRIKPRPKKVLRPAWEILREAQESGNVYHDDDGLVIVYGFRLSGIIEANASGKTFEPGTYKYDEFLFTSEETKR